MKYEHVVDAVRGAPALEGSHGRRAAEPELLNVRRRLAVLSTPGPRLRGRPRRDPHPLGHGRNAHAAHASELPGLLEVHAGDRVPPRLAGPGGHLARPRKSGHDQSVYASQSTRPGAGR